MEKIYRRKKEKISEALDEIDKFVEKMEAFMEENKNYKYQLNIQKQRKYWEILLTVIKDESK